VSFVCSRVWYQDMLKEKIKLSFKLWSTNTLQTKMTEGKHLFKLITFCKATSKLKHQIITSRKITRIGWNNVLSKFVCCSFKIRFGQKITFFQMEAYFEHFSNDVLLKFWKNKIRRKKKNLVSFLSSLVGKVR
jgi:hypothetical protein